MRIVFCNCLRASVIILLCSNGIRCIFRTCIEIILFACRCSIYVLIACIEFIYLSYFLGTIIIGFIELLKRPRIIFCSFFSFKSSYDSIITAVGKLNIVDLIFFKRLIICNVDGCIDSDPFFAVKGCLQNKRSIINIVTEFYAINNIVPIFDQVPAIFSGFFQSVYVLEIKGECPIIGYLICFNSVFSIVSLNITIYRQCTYSKLLICIIRRF